MIVVDTSVLMALLLKEARWETYRDFLASERRFSISAGTLAEARIVALGRGISKQLELLLAEFRPEIIPVDGLGAALVGEAYRRWGKGIHPAALNFGDCFAYALARQRDASLLFVGNDFARTDIRSALNVS